MTEAPLCLLLPGTLCDARLFAPLLQGWRTLGAHRHTLVADLHQLEFDIPRWWHWQLAHLPGRFDVLGFSLGGILALQLLGLAAERVRRLVLVASNPSAGTAMHRERVNAQLTQWHSQGPDAVARQMLGQASPAASMNPLVSRCVQDMARDTPTVAFMAQGEINATRADGLPVLERWGGPLLLVSGAQDPWCGADKQRLMLSVRPDARWHELPDCGHYLPLEQPAQLAALTDSFFREPAPPQRPTT